MGEHGLCQKIHESMMKIHCANWRVGHLSQDSTAKEARKKVIVLKPKENEAPWKGGRPKKGRRPKKGEDKLE